MLDFLGIGSKEKLKEGKRKIKIKYISFIEIIILLSIALTSFLTTLFITIPIFLTVIFLLIQIKKYIAYKINRPYLLQEKIRELVKKELKKNG